MAESKERQIKNLVLTVLKQKGVAMGKYLTYVDHVCRPSKKGCNGLVIEPGSIDIYYWENGDHQLRRMTIYDGEVMYNEPKMVRYYDPKNIE